uniref:VPS37B subunit of ESCRT-I n=1 Tax=Anas platyrhynchos TaxID=8839 RepID=A0A8B9T6J2_ANAPL
MGRIFWRRNHNDEMLVFLHYSKIKDDALLQSHCILRAQNVQHSKDMTLASNRSLAEDNLLFQPKLESLKANLTQKYQELQVLFEAYQIKKTKLDRQSSNASLETLLALLQTEGAKIEEDTENMAENFLDGEIPLDSFIDEYQSKQMVLKGQRLPQVQPLAQPRAPDTTPAPQDSYTSDANPPPSVVPRRIPPPPPSVPAGRFPTPFTAAMSSGPALSYPGAPYPPLPPRPGAQSASQVSQPGYPSQFVPPYPPALPQRPPRFPPHPGFILQ